MEAHEITINIDLGNEDIKFLGVGCAYAELIDEKDAPVDDIVGIRVDLGFIGPPDSFSNTYEVLQFCKKAIDQLLNDPAAPLWKLNKDRAS